MPRFLIILVIIFNLCVSSAFCDPLVIAAGAGYKRMLEGIIQIYKDKTGTKVDQIYGHMGQVLMQAKASGVVSLVLGEHDFLENSDVDFDSFHKIGNGILVLAYRKGVNLQKPEDLCGKGISKIAVPDPKQAVYGKAAREFLNNTGLGKKLGEKLLVVSTVPQVSAYVISKDVDAGFVNLTDAIYIRDKIGGFIELDKNKYKPISIVIGVTKNGANHPGGLEFLDFVENSTAAKAVITKAGL
ncbi:MAG: molybdate ABC transporter substrate-binding protein [Desulfomonilaceae bacterium]